MNWLQKLLGQTFLVNLHTGEIHNLSVENPHCKGSARVAKHNRKYVTEKRAKKLIATGKFNGCHWCYPQYDTDKR